MCAQLWSRKEMMKRNYLWRVVILSVWWLSAASMAGAASEMEPTHPQQIAGDRVLLGTVLEIRSEQARIDTGELEPRFIPMGVRKAKGLEDLKQGDLIEITVNDQNLLVDVHKAGESGRHRVVRGQLAGPMETGHDKAVIRTPDGKEESHLLRPVVRSKVASIPVGADVIFLIDEVDKIVDVTMGTTESVQRAAELGQKKSPLKGNLSQVAGKILKPLKDNSIVIRREDGKAHSYQVRPLIQPRLTKLSEGDAVILLVDDEQKVTDIAFVPKK